MTFNNSVDAVNTDFQLNSGKFAFATRDRFRTINITENLGIAYSAGTFTVQGANGSALSATNPGYIIAPSRANPGQQKLFTITSNQSFTDSTGANSLGNNLFGLTTNIAYAADLPFFIYFGADNTDSNGTFFISRVPHITVLPVAGNIAQSGNTNATTQGSVFAMQAITAANFAGQPCVCIGAFRMQYTSAASPWTVQTLTNGNTNTDVNLQSDGIGCFHEGSKFQMVTGQFGAATGSFFNGNGGTAPAWSSQAADFRISKAGMLELTFNAGTSTAGSGGQTTFFQLPYTDISSGMSGVINFTGSIGVARKFSGTNQQVDFVAVNTSSVFPVTNASLAVSVAQIQLTWQAEAI